MLTEGKSRSAFRIHCFISSSLWQQRAEHQADQRIARRHEEVVSAPWRIELDECIRARDDRGGAEPCRRHALTRHDPDAKYQCADEARDRAANGFPVDVAHAAYAE